jgi:hypothetical protein
VVTRRLRVFMWSLVLLGAVGLLAHTSFLVWRVRSSILAYAAAMNPRMGRTAFDFGYDMFGAYVDTLARIGPNTNLSLAEAYLFRQVFGGKGVDFAPAAFVLLFLWPFLSLVGLKLTFQSIRRVGIRPAQIHRCLAYSVAVGWAIFIVLVSATLVMDLAEVRWRSWFIQYVDLSSNRASRRLFTGLNDLSIIALPIIFLPVMFHLLMSYRRYLRFRTRSVWWC